MTGAVMGVSVAGTAYGDCQCPVALQNDVHASSPLLSSFCLRDKVPGDTVLLAHWSYAHPLACEDLGLADTQGHLTKGLEKLCQRRWGHYFYKGEWTLFALPYHHDHCLGSEPQNFLPGLTSLLYLIFKIF